MNQNDFSGILKERQINASGQIFARPPPGPPPGPPPPLSIGDDEEDDDEGDLSKRAIRAALQREKQLMEAENLVEKAMSRGSR